MAASDIVIAGLMLVSLAATGLLSAAALRLPLAPTLLAAYVAVVAETTLLTTALSPFRLVTRGGLAAGEAVLLLLAFGAWLRRGRWLPPARHLPAQVWEAVRDPATALLLAAVLASVVYELVLGLTVAPNNWDSLTYHLTRVAAWSQHGGVYWIPHAPTDRINEFQPLAEQEILFLFVATGTGALYALPQLLAEVALVVAIYLGARRLGFDLRRAACSALLFAALPLVALEASTAQNDLVAASLPAAAAALLIGACPLEVPVAGIAAALGLGVKLTTALALPVLLLLAYARGRRALGVFAVAGAASFVLLGIWSFVLNLAHTGHVLGHGGGRVQQQASPSLTGSPTTAFRVLYRLLDLTGLGVGELTAFVGLGLVAAAGVFLVERRRGSAPRVTAFAAFAVAVPLLVPRLVPDVAHALHIAADAVSLPVQARASTGGTFFWGISDGVNEDLSGFGPLAGPALLLISLGILGVARRRRAVLPVTALGLALPLFVVLLALTSKYNPWLLRFLLVPVALASPLLAMALRRPAVALAVAVVAVAGLVGVARHNQLKPLRVANGWAWHLTRAEALSRTFQHGLGATDSALARELPARACTGAILGGDEPAYLLYGPKLERRVEFLPRAGGVAAAVRAGLPAVVIGHVPGVAAGFAAAGWRLQALPARPAAKYWTLATAPASTTSRCPRAS